MNITHAPISDSTNVTQGFHSKRLIGNRQVSSGTGEIEVNDNLPIHETPDGSSGTDFDRILDLAYQPPAENELRETLSNLDKLPGIVRSSDYLGEEIDQVALVSARSFIKELFRVVTTNRFLWNTPNVTTEGEGDVTFEWWHANRTLNFFITSEEISYLWAWGPHIQNEMEEGQTPSDEKLLDLWKSLHQV